MAAIHSGVRRGAEEDELRRRSTTVQAMSDSGCSSISTIKIFYKVKGDDKNTYRTQVEDVPLGHAPTLGDFKRSKPRFAFYKAYCLAYEEKIGGQVRIELDGNSDELVKNANGQYELFLEPTNTFYDEPAMEPQREDDYTTFEETETYRQPPGRFGRFDSMASTSFSTTDNSNYHRRTRRHFRAPRPMSEYSTMLTESSMALDIVTINLDIRFRPLGIQVASVNGSGLIVANLIPGSAAATCGHINVGDLVLQVNDVSLDGMPDDQAAMYLAQAEGRRGFIALSIAKTMTQAKQPFFENPYAYYQPIPTAAAPQPAAFQPPSLPPDPPKLSTDSNKFVFLEELERSLPRKNRRWLKMDFPGTFLGAELVKWLRRNVEGVQSKREGRRFAQELMEAGIFRHVVSKTPFNEHCIYEICNDDLYWSAPNQIR
ncbi:hypothetical protein L596_019310 [Steinernema carpocapsae]|uniref:PDZ domain-containing protein n=1 Tax=Steinernema carpocapsae TaxID=34508 RepID=A0A4V6XVY8_STECR|nr:hypothetical protein L596_019310 [Steinernema carpocapsae]